MKNTLCSRKRTSSNLLVFVESSTYMRAYYTTRSKRTAALAWKISWMDNICSELNATWRVLRDLFNFCNRCWQFSLFNVTSLWLVVHLSEMFVTITYDPNEIRKKWISPGFCLLVYNRNYTNFWIFYAFSCE